MARLPSITLHLRSKIFKIVLTLLAFNQHALTLTLASTIRVVSNSTLTQSDLKTQNFTQRSYRTEDPALLVGEINATETSPKSRPTDSFTELRRIDEKSIKRINVLLANALNSTHKTISNWPPENYTSILEIDGQDRKIDSNGSDVYSNFTDLKIRDPLLRQVSNRLADGKLKNVSEKNSIVLMTRNKTDVISNEEGTPFQKIYNVNDSKSQDGLSDSTGDATNNQSTTRNDAKDALHLSAPAASERPHNHMKENLVLSETSTNIDIPLEIDVPFDVLYDNPKQRGGKNNIEDLNNTQRDNFDFLKDQMNISASRQKSPNLDLKTKKTSGLDLDVSGTSAISENSLNNVNNFANKTKPTTNTNEIMSENADSSFSHVQNNNNISINTPFFVGNPEAEILGSEVENDSLQGEAIVNTSDLEKDIQELRKVLNDSVKQSDEELSLPQLFVNSDLEGSSSINEETNAVSSKNYSKEIDRKRKEKLIVSHLSNSPTNLLQQEAETVINQDAPNEILPRSEPPSTDQNSHVIILQLTSVMPSDDDRLNTERISNKENSKYDQSQQKSSLDQSSIPDMPNSDGSRLPDLNVDTPVAPNAEYKQGDDPVKTLPEFMSSATSSAPRTTAPGEFRPQDSGIKTPGDVTNMVFSPSFPLASRLHAVEQLTAQIEFEGKDSVIGKLDAILKEILYGVNISQDSRPMLESWSINVTKDNDKANGTPDPAKEQVTSITSTKERDINLEPGVNLINEDRKENDQSNNSPELLTSEQATMDKELTEMSSFIGGNKTPKLMTLHKKVSFSPVPNFILSNLTDDIEHNQRLLDLLSQKLGQDAPSEPMRAKVSKIEPSDDSISNHSVGTADSNLRELVDREKSAQIDITGKPRELRYFPGYGLRSDSRLNEVSTNEREIASETYPMVHRLNNTQGKSENSNGLYIEETGRKDGPESIISTDVKSNKKISPTNDTIFNDSGPDQNSHGINFKDEIATAESSVSDSDITESGDVSVDTSNKDDSPPEALSVRSTLETVDTAHKRYPTSFYRNYLSRVFKPVLNRNNGVRPYYSPDNTIEDNMRHQGIGNVDRSIDSDQDGVGASRFDKNSFLDKYTEWQELLSHKMGAGIENRRHQVPFAPSQDDYKQRLSERWFPELNSEASQSQQLIQHSKLNSPKLASYSNRDDLSFDFLTYDDDDHWSQETNQLPGFDPRPSFGRDSSRYFEQYEPVNLGYDSGDLDNYKHAHSHLVQPIGYRSDFEMRQKNMYPSLNGKLSEAQNNFDYQNDLLSGEITQKEPLEFSNENELPRLIKEDSSQGALPIQQGFDSEPVLEKLITSRTQHTTLDRSQSTGYQTSTPKPTEELDVIERYDPTTPTQISFQLTPVKSQISKNLTLFEDDTNSLKTHRTSALSHEIDHKLKPLFETENKLLDNERVTNSKNVTIVPELLNNTFFQTNRDKDINKNLSQIDKTETNLEVLSSNNEAQVQTTPVLISYHRKASNTIKFFYPEFSAIDTLGNPQLNKRSEPQSISPVRPRDSHTIIRPTSLNVNKRNFTTQQSRSNHLDQNSSNEDKTSEELLSHHSDQIEKFNESTDAMGVVTESKDSSVVQKAYNLSSTRFNSSTSATLEDSNVGHQTVENITMEEVLMHRVEPEYVPEISAYKAQDFSLRQPSVFDTSTTATTKNKNNKDIPTFSGSGGDHGSDTISTATTNTNNITVDNLSNNISNLTFPLASKDGANGVQSHPLPSPLSSLPVFPALQPRAAMSAVLTTHFGPTKDRMIPFDLELLDLGDNYDNTSGTFICTVPGTYVINLHLMAHPGAKVNARVHVNSRPIAALWADDNGGAGFYPSSSSHTLTHLDFGDQVYVMLVDAGYGDSWVHANYNGFSVYLLYDDLPTF